MIRVRTGCEYDAQSFISRVGMPRQRIFRGAVAATLICGGAIWPSISRADAGAGGQPPMPPNSAALGLGNAARRRDAATSVNADAFGASAC